MSATATQTNPLDSAWRSEKGYMPFAAVATATVTKAGELFTPKGKTAVAARVSVVINGKPWEDALGNKLKDANGYSKCDKFFLSLTPVYGAQQDDVASLLPGDEIEFSFEVPTVSSNVVGEKVFTNAYAKPWNIRIKSRKADRSATAPAEVDEVY
jgi:hypothetical protein